MGTSSRGATTDLLILDYAINDAIVATAKTYDVDDDIVAPVARRYGASLVSYRDAFWPDVASPPHVAYWYNTRITARGRYGGPFRQDPHPTYEDHQLIADVLWLVFRLPCGDGPIRLTILRSYASVGSAQVRVSPPRAPGAAPAVDVDDGAVTRRRGLGPRRVDLRDRRRPRAGGALRRGRRARRRAPRAARDASRKLKFKLVGLEACAGLVNATT
ncbi:hypothetical protein JL722_1134 [Aureococcus anophagefferens]|nr:hypothetical protein JL722_1134 [Aureococcus anophagefferens]